MEDVEMDSLSSTEENFAESSRVIAENSSKK